MTSKKSRNIATGSVESSKDLLRLELDEIRCNYIDKRFTFVPGARMLKIIRCLGATTVDIARLKLASENLAPDPTLPFRKSRNGRFLMDFGSDEIRRLKFQPFVLSEEEDFVRHDSGQKRHFRGIQDEVQLNTAFQALMKFQASILNGVAVVPRPRLHQDPEQWVSTVFHLRTITNKTEVGEPALEGVHSDGVEHTMTTFVGSKNMRNDSAVSLIHDNAQQNGLRHHEVDESLVVGVAQHLSFLDTLLIIDHERKHTVSPVNAANVSNEATRDMLIFFTRRPTVEGHPTFPYDSLEPHPETPLSFPIGIKRRLEADKI